MLRFRFRGSPWGFSIAGFCACVGSDGVGHGMAWYGMYVFLVPFASPLAFLPSSPLLQAAASE